MSHTMEELSSIDSLARSYLEKAKCSGHWREYLQAHGLANYCASKEQTEQRCRLVYDIENSWYKGNHPLSYAEHKELTKSHNSLLEQYRNETRSDFAILQSLSKSFDTNNFFNTHSLRNASSFSEAVFTSSEKCSRGHVKVARQLLRDSVSILERGKEFAPCEFVVIGLGSVARAEATPYSDMDYAFLVEREDEYFLKLAMDSYFRIGNLQETPLKVFDISELQVTKCEPPILLAKDSTMGFRIDGITKNAGKIPTGNGIGSPLLTLTVMQLMDLYQTSAESPFAGIDGNSFDDVFSSTVPIYSNGKNSDAKSLYGEFRKARIEYEQTQVKSTHKILRKRFQSFVLDVKQYNFLPQFIKFQPPRNQHIMIKVDIYQYPTLLAHSAKLCFGLDTDHPWKTYLELHQRQHISEETFLYMKVILALSIYMRTSTYLAHHSSVQVIQVGPTAAGAANTLFEVPSNLFFILGYLLTPIKQSIQHNLNLCTHCSLENPQLDLSSILKQIHVNPNDHLLKAELFYFTGQYKAAKKSLSCAIGTSVDSISCAEFLEAIAELPALHTRMDKFRYPQKYSELACYLLYSTGNFKSALDYFDWFLSHQTGDSSWWKLLAAHCSKEMGDYKKARQLLFEAQPEQEFKINDDPHQDTCNFYCNIGAVFHDLGEDVNALKYHNKALQMSITLYGDIANTSHSRIYNNIGLAQKALGNHSSSLYNHMKSLDMMKAIYGADTNHPDMANCYSNIGEVYIKRGEYSLSFECFFKSLEMMKALYGSDTNHPDIANCYNNIGEVHRERAEYSLSSECFLKSLEMMKALYGSDTDHPDIAKCYSNIGALYIKRGEYSLSFEYFFKSLQMMKAIYGADTNHPDIANCYNNIGEVYGKRGEYSLSFEYFFKSLQKMKALYGADTNHPDLANCYSNIAAVYKERAEYWQSLEYFTKSLEMMKEIYGADTNHLAVASSFKNVANVNRKVGRFSLALDFYHQSVDMMRSIYGENHPYIANSCISIGDTYSSLGEHESACDKYREALRMMEAIYGPDATHPDIASCYDKVAKSLSERSVPDYASSLEDYKKSLSIREAVYGAEVNHPDIIASHNKIGNLYFLMKHNYLAKDAFEKAFTMAKKVYGAETNHPEIANCLSNIGGVKLKLEDEGPTSTLVYYTKSLKMQQKVYGAKANHPRIADTLDRIGYAYVEVEDYESAQNYYFKAQDMRKAVYGMETDHPDIALGYSNLGVVYHSLGEPVRSLDYFMKSLGMKETMYGKKYNHFDVATTYEKVASLNSELKRYVSALDYYTQALKLKEEIYEKEIANLHLAESYTYIGTVYSHLKEYNKSLDYHTRSLKLRLAKQADCRQEDVAESWCSVAKAQNFLEDNTKSLESYSKALDIQLDIHSTSPNCKSIAACYRNMAEVHNGMEDQTGALECYEKCLKMLIEEYGDDTNHTDIATCCTNMATIYTSLGKFTTALEYHTRALTMQQALSDARTTEVTPSIQGKKSVLNSDDYTDIETEYPRSLSTTEAEEAQSPAAISDREHITIQNKVGPNTGVSYQPQSAACEAQTIPQSLTAEISSLCQDKTVTSAMLVQDPDDWRSLIVIGVKAESLLPQLSDISSRYSQFSISIEDMDDALYTQLMTGLFAVRRSPVSPGVADWTGVNETREIVDDKATIEMLVRAEELKNDIREGRVVHTLYALAPAHLTMDNNQKIKFADSGWSVESIRNVVEGQSSNRRFTLRVNDHELYELGHPPLFCYRYWFSLASRSENSLQQQCASTQTPRDSRDVLGKGCKCESGDECHHLYMNDIALLEIDREKAMVIQQHLTTTQPAQVQLLLREIHTNLDLEELHNRTQPIVVRGKDGYLINVLLHDLAPNVADTDRKHTRHLKFRLRKCSDGTTQKLIPGDCGSIVYYQHKDGKCQPMGMLVGEFKLKLSGGPIYQAIILSQAFNDLECDYPHHVRDIHPFNP